jgi:hypothetical protein
LGLPCSTRTARCVAQEITGKTGDGTGLRCNDLRQESIRYVGGYFLETVNSPCTWIDDLYTIGFLIRLLFTQFAPLTI